MSMMIRRGIARAAEAAPAITYVKKEVMDEVRSMPYMKLKAEAKKAGINTEGMKAAEIRDALIAKLGV